MTFWVWAVHWVAKDGTPIEEVTILARNFKECLLKAHGKKFSDYHEIVKVERLRRIDIE